MQSPPGPLSFKSHAAAKPPWAGKKTRDKKKHGKIGSMEPPRNLPQRSRYRDPDVHCLATS